MEGSRKEQPKAEGEGGKEGEGNESGEKGLGEAREDLYSSRVCPGTPTRLCMCVLMHIYARTCMQKHTHTHVLARVSTYIDACHMYFRA